MTLIDKANRRPQDAAQPPRMLQQNFKVEFSYQVRFTQDLFDIKNPTLTQILPAQSDGPARMLVVIDDGVIAHHKGLPTQVSRYFAENQALIHLVTEPFVIPGGEQSKQDPGYLQAIQQLVCDFGICRHSYIIAIGGGAVLDAIGYAAATAHRGIRLIRVPTTVLSQNDSGVGVKNGINAFDKKNWLGTFAPPFAVLNDSGFLLTLDDRDWRSGIAEAVKVALIKAPEFFDFIEQSAELLSQRDMRLMDTLIYRCAELHLDHIGTQGDPFESGSSRPLDFGHWSAHKLEHLSNYRLRHGEAVAIGIGLDCIYSNLIGMLDKHSLQRILDTLSLLGFSLWEDELGQQDEHGELLIIKGLEEFREHLGGQLTFMLLSDIGSGVNMHKYDKQLYRRAIEVLRAHYAG